mmetsp:Transcript_17182/g.41826  ORF Transcript_17182/g.41826 Transcript_17182/m.41826 type:complete len:382 (-) Transcript_17182:187-1332(-)|eukprot:CAMPEP_0113617116 /NCGR_PEP_ID=MMETSP0017_2-20120614/8603_1 /TAXON_ID=2856 /ORGANISM="Cylindrotheca closterium" /LENGTH=381 /DNA_ID=CAMNT_0000526479 /DNA_START=2535 /DNA_END=3683 /DNA_ORIENTATION=- /assembly_acc=CAM_ASM_000147
MSAAIAAGLASATTSGDIAMKDVSDATTSTEANNANDARFYSFDETKMETFVKEKPWMNEAKYFQRVSLSPSSLSKMVMHCARGVEKGIAKGGNPTEVMGLLLGRPDPESPQNLIVTDAFPLPIEGFETRVVADDQDVVNHMISLTERLEGTRKEKFMGWYHSHPFELGDHSHCYLSQTDLSTQLQWQRAEDPHGNPFVAIVLDPLRSAHLGVPQLKAFRAFPPEFTSPVANQCPDGSVETSEQIRLEHWGSCWNRYYELSIDYYMSSTSRYVLEKLTQNYLWTTTLRQPTSVQKEQVQTIAQVAKKMSSSSAMTTTTASTRPGASSVVGAFEGGGAGANLEVPPPKEWQEGAESIQTLATEELAKRTLKSVQKQVFCPNK